MEIHIPSSNPSTKVVLTFLSMAGAPLSEKAGSFCPACIDLLQTHLPHVIRPIWGIYQELFFQICHKYASCLSLTLAAEICVQTTAVLSSIYFRVLQHGWNKEFAVKR